MSKTIFIVLLSVILFQDGFSQGSGNKYAGEWLQIGVGGRPKGMGGAYVALVDDVTSGYWNPGGLSKINWCKFITWIFYNKNGNRRYSGYQKCFDRPEW